MNERQETDKQRGDSNRNPWNTLENRCKKEQRIKLRKGFTQINVVGWICHREHIRLFNESGAGINLNPE